MGKTVLRVLVRVLIALVFVLLGMTARTMSAGDEGIVEDSGTATVQSCQQVGPVDIRYGLGIWNECQVAVQWDHTGYQKSTTVRPPYLSSADVGHKVRVDELYQPHHSDLVVTHDHPRLVWVFYVVTVPCIGIAIIILMWPVVRALRRRGSAAKQTVTNSPAE